MASFSIGEVEKITGVKAHILRYWEEVVPSLEPQKDIGGRRSYSSRDVQLIMRLKHLINEKKYSIEEARNRIIAETQLSEAEGNSLQTINQLKGELLDLFKSLKTTDSKAN